MFALKKAVSASAVNTVDPSLFRTLANESSIRTDAVNGGAHEDVLGLHLFLKATHHVPCFRRDIAQSFQHPLTTDHFVVVFVHFSALSCPSDP